MKDMVLVEERVMVKNGKGDVFVDCGRGQLLSSDETEVAGVVGVDGPSYSDIELSRVLHLSNCIPDKRFDMNAEAEEEDCV